MIAQGHLELGARDMWSRIDVEDPRAARLADRHYSRQTVGARGLMPPGKRFLLWHETNVGAAIWGVCLNMDPTGELRWRNTIFRNESGTLSSELVRAATISTGAVWVQRYKELPEVSLTTEIDIEETKARRGKRNQAGHCYRWGGWRDLGVRERTHGRPAVAILEAPLEMLLAAVPPEAWTQAVLGVDLTEALKRCPDATVTTR